MPTAKTARASKPEENAERLLKKYGHSLPIDVEQIAIKEGLDVIYKPLEDSVSGMCFVKGNRGIIVINSEQHPNRQRFSLAHELGHYVMADKKAGERYFVDKVFFRAENDSAREKVPEEEMHANRFAAALLMPKEEVEKFIAERPLDDFDEVAIRRLAARFGVSPQALTIRISKLQLYTL